MLTAKKKAFVDVYTTCRNASESARQAGYSVKTCRQAGSRLLTDVDVKQAIDAWEAEERAKNEAKKRERSKDNFIEEAYKAVESLPVEDSTRPRYLEIAGRALGYLGKDGDKPNQTLIINVDAKSLPQGERWDRLRSLIDGS